MFYFSSSESRMSEERDAITHEVRDGIAEVVIYAAHPVNALDVASWFRLADVVRELGANRDVRVVILRAEGRASTPASTSRRCRTSPASRRCSAPIAAASQPSPPSTSAKSR